MTDFGWAWVGAIFFFLVLLMTGFGLLLAVAVLIVCLERWLALTAFAGVDVRARAGADLGLRAERVLDLRALDLGALAVVA